MTKKIKPKFDDLIVRDPTTKQPLSKDGEIKDFSGIDGKYWNRRLLDGSVIIIDENEKKSHGGKK